MPTPKTTAHTRQRTPTRKPSKYVLRLFVSGSTLNLGTASCVPLKAVKKVEVHKTVMKLSTANIETGTGGSGTPASAMKPRTYFVVTKANPILDRGTGNSPSAL